MGVVAQPLGQPFLQQRAHGVDVRQQILVADHLLHRQRRGTGKRMRLVGVAVHEATGAVADRVQHTVIHQDAPDRLVAAAQPLGDDLDVGGDAFGLPRMQRAAATHPGHHLVQDQQGAVAVAHRAHGGEIPGQRRHAAQRGADHRLGHEGGHGVGADALEFGLELIGQALDVCGIALAVGLVAIGVAGRDVAEGVGQDGRVGRAAHGVAAHRQRTQRVAVVALPPRDEV